MTDEDYCKGCGCWLLSYELKQTGYCCNCNNLRINAKQEVYEKLIAKAYDNNNWSLHMDEIKAIRDNDLSPINTIGKQAANR